MYCTVCSFPLSLLWFPPGPYWRSIGCWSDGLLYIYIYIYIWWPIIVIIPYRELLGEGREIRGHVIVYIIYTLYSTSIKPTVNQLVNNYQRQTDRPANRTGQHAGTLTTVFHSTRTQQCGMDSVVWKNLNVIKPCKRTNKKIFCPEKRSRCREICRKCPPQSTRKNVASAHLRAQGKMLRVPTSEHKEKCRECPPQSTRKAGQHSDRQGGRQCF